MVDCKQQTTEDVNESTRFQNQCSNISIASNQDSEPCSASPDRKQRLKQRGLRRIEHIDEPSTEECFSYTNGVEGTILEVAFEATQLGGPESLHTVLARTSAAGFTARNHHLGNYHTVVHGDLLKK